MSQLLSNFKEQHFLSVKLTALHGLGDPSTIQKLYGAVLNANLCDIAEPGGLPGLLLAQANATVKIPMLLQVAASRDATQPLRPCADMSEEEAFMLGSPGQANFNKKRLLKLILTDGHSELPAIELQTQLTLFKSVPMPGEKVLVKEGAEIRNGMLILTPENVTPLGGGVDSLRREYEFRKQRNVGAVKAISGGDGAPKFQPFSAQAKSTFRTNTHAAHAQSSSTTLKPPHSLETSSRGDVRGGRGGEGARGRGEGRGRGGRGESGRGRGSESGRGRGSDRGRGDGRGGRGEGRGRGRGGGERGAGRGRGGDARSTTNPVTPSPSVPFSTNFIPAFNDTEDFPCLGDY